MAKINKEEYEILKGLDVEWNWIARDGTGVLICYIKKPKKYKIFLKLWTDSISPLRYIDNSKFQFIQWEDSEPYNIQELIDEYEVENGMRYDFGKMKVVDIDTSKLTARVYGNESEETEVKKDNNISLQDVTHRLWELPLNDRKYWLEYLNDEFQKGYIVPLGLKTTDGKDQYLTFAGSYFASRRNKHLQQTFATLEEIPEFYRDLAERML